MNKKALVYLYTVIFLPIYSVNAQFFGKEEIMINHGSKYVNTYKAELRFKVEDDSIESMLVSNVADFHGTHWVDYHPEILDWSLKFEDGLQEVFAKFKYRNGKESEIFVDEIIVDTTPPENPYIKIEVPSKYTNDQSFIVDLSISASDAKYIKLSNTNSFYGKKWRLYKDNQIFDWRLEQGDDGPRTVYAKFRDKAGNESEVTSDEIIIDTKAPFDVHIQYNNSKKFLTDRSKRLEVNLFARGADSVAVSINDPKFANVQWDEYQTAWSKILDEEDGPKTIYVKFKDFAGNETEVFSQEVILDTTPPTNCEVTINKGAESTNQLDKLVTVSLQAEGAEFFKISNDPLKFETVRWQVFTNNLDNWRLDGENDGMRTIYVKFKDAASNISKTYKASIMLERGF